MSEILPPAWLMKRPRMPTRPWASTGLAHAWLHYSSCCSFQITIGARLATLFLMLLISNSADLSSSCFQAREVEQGQGSPTGAERRQCWRACALSAPRRHARVWGAWACALGSLCSGGPLFRGPGPALRLLLQ